ncbi:MAG: amino acid transporter substrate-binding protein family [Blastococcus sp.]|jgi:polar amino acid transport system substrate-binding protein|nr:amino acid transporter substrate-binding protein family [Blastococcus sp.]
MARNARARRASGLVGGLAALSLLVTGCGGDSGGGNAPATDDPVAALKEAGAVTIGLANQPPYSGVEPGGELVGVAPDVTQTVLGKLGIDEVEGVAAQYGDLIPGLDSGRWDMIGAALNITPERCKQVLFGDPIVVSTSSFAVEPGNPSGLGALEDVATSGDKLGVLQGSNLVQVAEAAGVPSDAMVEFPDVRSAIDGLGAGRVAAVFNNTTALEDLAAEKSSSFDIVDASDAPVDFSSVAFRKADTGLRDAFNEQLGALRDSGDLAKILEKWGFADVAEYEGVTADQVCAGDV